MCEPYRRERGQAGGIAEEQGLIAGCSDLPCVVEQHPHRLAAGLPDGQGHGLRRGLRQHELGAFHGAGLIEADQDLGSGPLLARQGHAQRYDLIQRGRSAVEPARRRDLGCAAGDLEVQA